MTKWHLSDEGEDDLAHRILKVSHLYASRWEFIYYQTRQSF